MLKNASVGGLRGTGLLRAPWSHFLLDMGGGHTPVFVFYASVQFVNVRTFFLSLYGHGDLI